MSLLPSVFENYQPFVFENQQWIIEGLPLSEIAEKYGTPCYVYSKSALETAFRAFDTPFQDYPHHIHYAVKANSNLAVLKVLAQLGAGFDIVSRGELERVLKAGGDPQHIIFSGVGKTKEELLRAVEVNVGCVNIESASELQMLNELGRQAKKQISIALRVNPNIDSKSHPYISTGLKENKFGILTEEALQLAQAIHAGRFSNLRLVGLACHIGSQITELDPFIAAVDKMLELIHDLQKMGVEIEILNMGGGLGITYQSHDAPPSPKSYVEALVSRLKKQMKQHAYEKIKIYLEPGRAIAAASGVLLTQVHHLKKTQDKNFAIVDAGMNDLLRPALYQAYQEIQVIKNKPAMDGLNGQTDIYDIVGPVCETADFLGKNRKLALEQGTVLAVFNAGAYGFSMSSNYNSRPRPPEIMVDGNKSYLVRPRESYDELFHTEQMID